MDGSFACRDKEAQESTGPAPFACRLPQLLFLAGIFFLNFLCRIIFGPLLPPIEKQLSLSHAQAGALFFFLSMGYFISLSCAGFVSSRLFHRRTILFSAVMVGAALVGIASSESLWGIRLGLFGLGFAAGVYLPSGMATLTTLIRPGDWGKGIAVHELAPNLGFVAAPLLVEVLLIPLSWRGILLLLAFSSLAVGLCYARWGKGGDFPGQAPSFGVFRRCAGDASFWFLLLFFCLGITGTLGIYTMLPLYLVAEKGIDRNLANTLVALSRVSSPVMALAAGWFTDRWGPRVIIRSVFLLTGMMTLLLGVTSGKWLILAVFLQPLLAVCYFPAGFAALSRISTPETRNVIISLTIPTAFLVGGGLVPMLIGIIGDAGRFYLGMASAGALILGGFILSFFLRLPEQPGC